MTEKKNLGFRATPRLEQVGDRTFRRERVRFTSISASQWSILALQWSSRMNFREERSWRVPAVHAKSLATSLFIDEVVLSGTTGIARASPPGRGIRRQPHLASARGAPAFARSWRFPREARGGLYTKGFWGLNPSFPVSRRFWLGGASKPIGPLL